MLVAEIPQDINYSSGNASILEVQDAQPTNMPADSASHSDHSSSEDASLATCSKMRKDGGSGVKSIRLDISFKSQSHTGLQTSELVLHTLHFHLNLSCSTSRHVNFLINILTRYELEDMVLVEK